MTVNIEMKQVAGKARIVLTSNEFKIRNKCKSVAGATPKFDDDGTFLFWYYPLDMTTARSLRTVFPHLKIGPRLTEWAKSQVKHRKDVNKLHVLKSAEPVDLPLVRTLAPTIWRAYQGRGFQTIVPKFASQVGRHFNADQPGCGKTIEELGALVECGIRGSVLVIAPRKALRATWVGEITRWLGPDFKVEIDIVDSEEYGSGHNREAELDRIMGPHSRIVRKRRGIDFHFVLVNPEMIRWKFLCPGDKNGENKCRNGNAKSCDYRKNHDKEPLHPEVADYEWDAVLADETHKFLMHANERSGSVSQVGYGFQRLSAKPPPLVPGSNVGYKVGMSGTPFKGKARRFWPILHWLDRKVYTGAGRWNEQYFTFVQDTNPFSRSSKRVTDEMREDRREMFNEDLGMILVRRTKRELHAMNPEWAPPDKIFVPIYLEMDSKQKKAYKSMELDAMAKVEGGMLMANGLLAEMTRLKQLACAYGRIEKVKKNNRKTKRIWYEYKFKPALPSCKWDWIKNVFLAERGILDNDGEMKVAIVSQYVELIDLYAVELDKLRVPYYVIAGRTDDVEAIQEDWNSPGGPRVLLLSTQAGGTSLTLDKWVDDVVVDDETWIEDDQEQAVDRFHRTGRTDHQVMVYRLISRGTIDERIVESNDALDEIQKKILDGRRGVSYVKQYLLGDGLAA